MTPLLHSHLHFHLLVCFRYGAYFNKEQVAELVRPPPKTVGPGLYIMTYDLPPSWLLHGGSWLTIMDILISQANQLLGVSYQLYQNLKTNNTIISMVGYTLPAVLHQHIQTVVPMTYFLFTQGMQQTPHMRPFGEAATQMQAMLGDILRAAGAWHHTIYPALVL